MFKLSMAAPAGLLTAALLLGGCQDDPDMNPQPADVAEGDVTAGENVTVEADVVQVYDARAVLVEGEGELFAPNLVVVTLSDLPSGLAEGDRLMIEGTVRKMGHIEIEKELTWDFDEEVDMELEDVHGYLVARTVAVVPDDEP